MTVVVTGVTSFIGIYTARALLKTGDRVIGVVRPESHNLLKLTQAGITMMRISGWCGLISMTCRSRKPAKNTTGQCSMKALAHILSTFGFT